MDKDAIVRAFENASGVPVILHKDNKPHAVVISYQAFLTLLNDVDQLLNEIKRLDKE